MKDVRDDRSGFTLIELLVVVAILGLVGMVAIPASASSAAHNLDVVEVQVRDAFERAISLARSTRQTHAVVFDTATDRFAVVDGAGTAVVDPLTKGDYVVAFDVPGQPKGIAIVSASFGANGPAAIFDGQGVPVEAGSVTFGCRSATRSLALNKATGKLATL